MPRARQERAAVAPLLVGGRAGILAQFEALLSSAPLGIVFFDRELRYVYINESLAAVNGLPVEQHHGRTLREVLPGLAPTLEPMLERVLATGEPLSGVEVSTALAPGRRGEMAHWLVSYYPVRDGDGRLRGVGGIITEVTAQKEIERRLRESETRLTLALEGAHMGTWEYELRTGVVRWSPTLEPIFGLAPGTFGGTFDAFLDCVHPADRDDLLAAIARAVEAGGEYEAEFRIVWPDGSVRWIVGKGRIGRDEGGQPARMVGIGMDVTARKNAEAALQRSLEELRHSEERLRALARQQETIREEERKRLGFDLHDNVCQELVGIAIFVDSLRQRVAPLPAAAEADVRRIIGYLNEVVEHLRGLARDLRPLLLHDLGLEGSLRSLSEGMSTQTMRVVATFPAPVPRLQEAAEIAVYRIAQEALTNAVRHASAGSIELMLAFSDRMLCLEVSDDGRGFDPAEPAETLGLAGMRERALALGGRVTVWSARGRGTTVRLECPLERHRLQDA